MEQKKLSFAEYVEQKRLDEKVLSEDKFIISALKQIKLHATLLEKLKDA